MITKLKLEIFNRFGEKVYSSEDINESWNGYFRGKLLSPQVFDYYLEIECVGKKTLFENLLERSLLRVFLYFKWIYFRN